MHWIYLVCAIFFEVAGTTCMKLSNGLSQLTPTVLMIFFYIASFSFMSIALKKMEMSIAYAIWCGVGIALISCIGFFYFREPMTTLKAIGLLAVAGGVIALCFAETAH